MSAKSITTLKRTLLAIVMILISLIAFAPFYMMFIMSTHVTEDLYKGLVLLPGKLSFEKHKHGAKQRSVGVL